MIVKSADDLCSYYPNLTQCHLHLKYNRDDLYKIVNNSLKKKKDLKDICWKRMYLD
jgi:hypothetical protein